MTDTDGLLADLVAEGDELDHAVSTLDEAGWRTPTPADGWTIAHQIAHLTWTDRASVLAATDVDAFSAELRTAMAEGGNPVDAAAAQGAAQPPAELLAAWRRGRTAVVDALRAVPRGQKLPWFGPPMSAASMATARLMETFGHGQDVLDALRISRVPTARLRHVAHIGVRTVGFAFAVHGLAAPEQPFRIELTGPAGDLWTWGADDATNRITAPALDFALLVTQRRHPADLRVTATGDQARQWVPIAQAFAGPPGAGRKPGAVA
ncbi:MAG TPA: TIGR03084 family metal-binding protein [Pseudonocardiaceae bacterium]|nr:TIGR03084 family metal-binding protein [Pseudonocardiaceae bacterium]